MKKLIFILLQIVLPILEPPTVLFDYPAVIGDKPITLAQVNGYTATLYVNETPFILVHNCILNTTTNVYNCVAPLPNISIALAPLGKIATVNGIQNFEITFKDAIFEGPKSTPPLQLNRPVSILNLRIQ